MCTNGLNRTFCSIPLWLREIRGRVKCLHSYFDGIVDLFGVMLSWSPHQADDETLKLARQLIFQVIDQVLEEGHVMKCFPSA